MSSDCGGHLALRLERDRGKRRIQEWDMCAQGNERDSETAPGSEGTGLELKVCADGGDFTVSFPLTSLVCLFRRLRNLLILLMLARVGSEMSGQSETNFIRRRCGVAAWKRIWGAVGGVLP